jgi:hypothetical protein
MPLRQPPQVQALQQLPSNSSSRHALRNLAGSAATPKVNQAIVVKTVGSMCVSLLMGKAAAVKGASPVELLRQNMPQIPTDSVSPEDQVSE